MKLKDWFTKNPKETVASVALRAGVSTVTVRNACHGLTLSNYGKARSISKATGGAVTIGDLCGGEK